MRVQTQYTKAEGGDDGWYHGTITQVSPPDAVQIQYDDGDSERVESRFVHPGNPAQAGPPAMNPQYPPPGGQQPPMPGNFGYGPGMHQQGPPQQMMGGPVDVHVLSSVPGLYVKQRVDHAEVIADLLGGVVGGVGGDLMSNFEVSNTYDIYTDRQAMEMKNRWLFAKEESDACSRYACQAHREFRMRIGAPVQGPNLTIEEKLGLVTSDKVIPAVELERPCYCCLSEMHVRDGRGRDIGHIEEECTNLVGCCPLKANIQSPQGDMRLTGPPPCWIACCMSCPCREPFEFRIEGHSGPVGEVLNVPNGCCKMCFTSADEYELKFAPASTPDQRALVLAAAFALDYAYFESKNERSSGDGEGLW